MFFCTTSYFLQLAISSRPSMVISYHPVLHRQKEPLSCLFANHEWRAPIHSLKPPPTPHKDRGCRVRPSRSYHSRIVPKPNTRNGRGICLFRKRSSTAPILHSLALSHLDCTPITHHCTCLLASYDEQDSQRLHKLLACDPLPCDCLEVQKDSLP
jgi:hypothetical protein